MKNISVTLRISLCLVGISTNLLLAAEFMGMFPDEAAARIEGRSTMCEAIAISSSLFAARGDLQSMQRNLEELAHRKSEILSMGVRTADDQLVVEVGGHATEWQAPQDGKSTQTHVYIPITRGDDPWGTVEVQLRPVREAGWRGILGHPVIMLILFLGSSTVLAYYLFLRRVLRELNPSKVVPMRVQNALDTLAEGLLLLNPKGQIVLANRAFGETVRCDPDDLMGLKASELPWLNPSRGKTNGKNGNQKGSALVPDAPHPWSEVLHDGQARTGSLLSMQLDQDHRPTFMVNATPIVDDRGSNRGVLASFEDVTPLEEKKVELAEMLERLRTSRDEIRRQNQELEVLAQRDPLTGCFNRRSFFEKFETHWSAAQRYGHPLSCIMVDVDHFKSINDRHGHARGDEVLRQVASRLRSASRDSDVVCRYGGEEFVILLPHTPLEMTVQVAERFREGVENAGCDEVQVTVSLGVSALSLGAADPQTLLDQADKCLYVAKRNGRNQVARWDQVPADLEIDESQVSPTLPPAHTMVTETIPFQAVSALVSALDYRDPVTADHSQRVADLCVMVSRGLMPLSECYLLENAALLHDIGKIGMPDSILHKTGPLTEEEWKLMRTHDRVGAEIIRASFGSEQLAVIVANHHLHYAGSEENPGRPRGLEIPLSSRVLSIADAYDSMVSERPYRQALSGTEAIAELRRCAGTQFDPELVDRFIDCMEQHHVEHSGQATSIPRETVLAIGQQIEHLLNALDQQDLAGLKTLAGRLKAGAQKQGVDEMAQKASLLETALDSDEDLVSILRLANELIDLCRATQKSYLRSARSDEPAPAAAL